MDGGQESKIKFSAFFTESQFETQAETLAVEQRKSRLTIGIPKEHEDENRVALVPNSIRSLVGFGHRVVVEAGAGERSSYSDNDYGEAGAKVVHSRKEIFKSDIILKISPISIEEIDMMLPEKLLIAPMQLPTLTAEKLKKLREKKIIALAMEYLQTEDGSYPIIKIMSEISGMAAIYTAAELLSNVHGGRGVLLGGISGVPPAKIVILGAGDIAEHATKLALSVGATVRIFDNDVTKIMRLQSAVGRQLHTSTINPVYLAYQLVSADVVIGAMHAEKGRPPMIVTEEMVSKMKEGSVIIDLSIDQGGCIETSEMTNHKKPTFVKHGVIHYCVPNIPSKVSRTSSVAISNILTPLLIMAGGDHNIESLLYRKKGIRHGCYVYKGAITNEYLGRKFELNYTDLDLLLTSKF